MTDELDELRHENFRLRSMLAKAGITIPPSVDLPNAEQEAELLRLVASTYPVLRCTEGSEKVQFANALHFLCFAYRTDRLATDRSAAFWFDLYGEWGQARGYDRLPMNLKPFTAAAVASGVAHSPIAAFPYVSFGLSLGSVVLPSTAWKATLRNRSLIPPTELVTSNAKRRA